VSWPPCPEALRELADRLAAGGLALVPTDTVYGLAAALDAPAGVDALYAAKGRPREQPCQVLLFAPGALAEALEALPEPARTVAAELLPGPATCLVPDPALRYRAASGATPGTVGLRAPDMGGALDALDLPLVATSANDPGGPDPAILDAVPGRLRAATAELDAGRLPGTASAVVDLRPLADGGAAVLIRPGPDPDALRARLARHGVRLQAAVGGGV
jgi:tRNA threonylcarbamoyl adenosine modification protein (Sua5/YciO/YrdC/YwlC family)